MPETSLYHEDVRDLGRCRSIQMLVVLELAVRTRRQTKGALGDRVEDGRGPARWLLATGGLAFNQEAAAELDAGQQTHFAGMEEEQALRSASVIVTAVDWL